VLSKKNDMMQNIKKNILTISLGAMLLGMVGAPMIASAQNPSDFGYKQPGAFFGNKAATANQIIPGGNYQDPRTLAQNIINIVLGFLGIIAVVIVLAAGFQWMTAGGEEEKVKEAQQRLIQGAIGLVLIVAAWMIAYYVIDQVVGAVQGR